MSHASSFPAMTAPSKCTSLLKTVVWDIWNVSDSVSDHTAKRWASLLRESEKGQRMLIVPFVALDVSIFDVVSAKTFVSPASGHARTRGNGIGRSFQSGA